jgi:hypothetical protein
MTYFIIIPDATYLKCFKPFDIFGKLSQDQILQKIFLYLNLIWEDPEGP